MFKIHIYNIVHFKIILSDDITKPDHWMESDQVAHDGSVLLQRLALACDHHPEI